MNWGVFGLSVFALIFLGWVAAILKGRPPWPGLVSGLAFIVVAGANAAAPFRGFVDVNYVGYTFGYLRAARGMEVTLVAGGVLLAAILGAFASALGRGRGAMGCVALLSLFFLIIIGGPWAMGAIRDPDANSIEFGEYLRIPGAIGTALLFLLTVLPFAVGLIWAGRRVFTRG